MVLPITYVIFKYWAIQPWIPFFINIVGISIGIMSNLWTIKLYIPAFELKKFFYNEYISSLLLFFGIWAICWPITLIIPQGFGRLVIVCITSTILLGLIGYFIYIPKVLRLKLKEFIVKKFGHNKILA